MKKLILFSIIILCGLQTTKNVDATNYQMATRVDLGYAHATQLMPVSIFTNSVLWMPFSQQTSFYSIAKTPDFSSDHNDGTVYGATFDNGSYSFDGGDKIELDGLTYNIGDDYTLSLWTKPTTIDSTDNSMITADASANTLLFDINDADSIRMRSRASVDNVEWAVDTSKILNNWTLITLVHGENYFELFTNAVSLGQLTITDASELRSNWRIGYRYTSAGFKGNLDDVRIYDRALTGLEITNIYNRTKGAH